jgi:hypothetical protein
MLVALPKEGIMDGTRDDHVEPCTCHTTADGDYVMTNFGNPEGIPEEEYVKKTYKTCEDVLEDTRYNLYQCPLGDVIGLGSWDGGCAAFDSSKFDSTPRPTPTPASSSDRSPSSSSSNKPTSEGDDADGSSYVVECAADCEETCYKADGDEITEQERPACTVNDAERSDSCTKCDSQAADMSSAKLLMFSATGMISLWYV